MTPDRVPILVYHHVYRDEDAQRAGPAAGVLGLGEFTRQIRFLRDAGWAVVSTTDVVEWLTNGGALGARSCVLHFDNGWLDTYEIARPVLADLGLGATCYPITSGIDAASARRSAAVRTLTEGWVEKPFMTWAQVSALKEQGWEIGAHTHTHCRLEEKHEVEGDEAVLEEVRRANARFGAELGLAPQHFAYPSGSRNERTDELLGGIYRSLRRWEWRWPIHWTFTDRRTSALGLHCQNIDARVPFQDFRRIFQEACAPAGSRRH